ncbi:hypothetical protein S2091_3553 [Solimicrobium silvestre]|uniref:Uncharacterized protein n=1 Tax=Solimicrobium silvestre TaxID=2099400 RepID=A0A2S9GVS2_9BURK|nr:hypothetical protein S2091_3553 [Solimicrobium silvestre]
MMVFYLANYLRWLSLRVLAPTSNINLTPSYKQRLIESPTLNLI